MDDLCKLNKDDVVDDYRQVLRTLRKLRGLMLAADVVDDDLNAAIIHLEQSQQLAEVKHLRARYLLAHPKELEAFVIAAEKRHSPCEKCITPDICKEVDDCSFERLQVE